MNPGNFTDGTGGPGGTGGPDGSAGGDAKNDTPVTITGNPFDGASLFVNPDWVAEIETSATADPTHAKLYKNVEAYSTGIWLDSSAKAAKAKTYLDAALTQQRLTGTPVLTTFVIYDLPDRDCAANASNGEFSIAANGEALYKTQYIDVIAAQFKAHPAQRIVAIIEPDSLPNLATNLSIAKCAAADPVYRRSVAYAISTLALPNVALYLDAAHAGWLGWANNRAAAAAIFADVLTKAGGDSKIRGFASNTSNYNSMHGGDGATLEPSDPCPDELSYVSAMATSLTGAGIKQTHFIVDTSRSGKSGIRSKWGEWCNLKGAGIGERPTVAPVAGVDAYVWAKPPGESDGTSDATAARYDSMCGNADSAPSAPQAGTWFASAFTNLVLNAQPPF